MSVGLILCMREVLGVEAQQHRHVQAEDQADQCREKKLGGEAVTGK